MTIGMRPRSLAGLSALILALGVVGGIGIQRVLSARSKPAPPEGIASDSCAYLEPILVQFLFNCDSMTSDTAIFCEHSREKRAIERKLVTLDVNYTREAWTMALRSSRVVDRLESGEIVFTPELGQRIYDKMFSLVGYGSMAKSVPAPDTVRPITRRGFIDSLKCLPHTWASIMLSSIRSLTDLDLREIQSKLPKDIMTFKAEMERYLSSVGAAP